MADDKRLERIESKIDFQAEHLADMAATLKLQHLSLATHIKRTDLLEAQLKPIVRWVYMTQGAVGLLTIVAIVASIYAVFK